MKSLFNLIFPISCPICRSFTSENSFCHNCFDTLEPKFEEDIIYLADYQQLERAIKALKFAGRRDIAAPIGQKLAIYIEKIGWPIDVVVPVPLHIKRQRQRGYNQAEEIAKHLAKTLKKPLISALVRHKETKKQSELSKNERQINVIGAFKSVKDTFDLNILLVDDVLTTGNTLKECLKVIKAKRIFIAIAAKS